MNIQLVCVDKIDGVWPCIKGQILRALAECDDLKLSEMYSFCRSGRGFLFVSEDLKASLILGFENRNGFEVARVYAMGADTNADWKQVFQDIKKFAQANGAEKIVFQGRKGWAKIFGIEPKYYHYEV